MAVILVNDDFSSYVYLDDAEMQAIQDAIGRLTDAIQEAIGRITDAIGQLISGTVEQLLDAMDDLPPMPDAPAWPWVPAIMPGDEAPVERWQRLYIPP